MKRKASPTPLTHRVHTVVNRRLTIWGVERRMWMFAALMGAATFNSTTSLLAGLFVFLMLYGGARCGTAWDPAFHLIVPRVARYRARYDPAKWARVSLVVTLSCDDDAGSSS